MQQIRGENVLTLKSQSQTRWSCRHDAALALKNRLVSVLQTLLKIKEPTPKATAECTDVGGNFAVHRRTIALSAVGGYGIFSGTKDS